MEVDELMRWASACAASGDGQGEINAYSQADALGDAEAAILLGNALLATGQLQSAREAYERAEQRGHREAAMCLGNLLSDHGDLDGAKAAYLRSIGMGSTIASLNLGLMLAGEGQVDEALVHLRVAAEQGDASAFWGIGKIQANQRDWVSAAASFRRGADLGDPACAFELGRALQAQGDTPGARAALQQARDLGHDRAAEALELLDREESAPGAGDGTLSVSDLWTNVVAVYGALAAQRMELGRAWIAATLAVQDRQMQVDALKAAESNVRRRYEAARDRFSVMPERSNEAGAGYPATTSPTDWLTKPAAPGGRWELAPRPSRSFDADIEEATRSLTQAIGKTFGGGLRHKGAQALGRASEGLVKLEWAIQAAQTELANAQTARTTAAEASAQRAHEQLSPVTSLATSSAQALPPVLQPWSHPGWTTWDIPSSASMGLRLAYGGSLMPQHDERLGSNAAFGTDLRIPWGLTLHDSWYIAHDGGARATAHDLMRSAMVRHLLTVEPGELKFCIFDPVGLGQSAGDLLHLAEYNPDLIGGKVWSSSQDLDGRLVELSAHIELVIQKYLRTSYASIDEFNEAAGEIAEPYRMLVLFDFPHGVSGEAAARLQSVVENGPRCGVFTFIAADGSVDAPYGVDPSQLAAAMRVLNVQGAFRDNIDGYQLVTSLEHDGLADTSAAAKRIIDAVGRASIARTESAVTFEKVFHLYAQVVARGLRPELGTAAARTTATDPQTWWMQDSTPGLFAPIGQKGARDVAILGLDSGDHAGVLMVGRPGSGKSTLLHTYLGGLTTLYGPDELELFLIDFKEGVEFKAYAQERLPHARIIAIESDREFGLSVLQSLQSEISQRAELLRSTGGRHVGMEGLRQATGEKLPRILLVFDEFQVLFARNDRLGLAAADLLESIIRQGRGFGIHVLLGSQSLAGLDALGAHVPQLLPVRILLPAAEADARKLLGEHNDGGDYLTSHGEGILNSAGGSVEANERFKGALLTEADRVARLQVLREKADSIGFQRVPMVFEGNALVPLDTQSPYQFREELTATGTYPMRVRAGMPMTVGDLGDLVLAREGGANILAIVRSGADEGDGIQPAGGPAYGLLVAAVASCAMTESAIDVVDFMSNDDGLDDLLEPLIAAGRITVRRRRAFPDLLASYASEVARRIEDGATGQSGRVLLLFGIHRARELDSEFGSLDVDADLVEQLERVMRDGPEAGVHVWMWSDTVAGASRRLTPRMMRELSWRLAGRMSADDSQVFVGSGLASDLRESQLLIVNDDRSTSTRVSAYAPPSVDWLAQLIATKPR